MGEDSISQQRFSSSNSGVFCFILKEAAFLPSFWLAEWRGRSLIPCVGLMAPPFQLSLCAAGSRKKNRSEMRGEKNRETEWESSRWDDIMCTAAELQQQWNKGSHSHTAMKHTKPISVDKCVLFYIETNTHSLFGFQIPIVGGGIYWIWVLIYSPVLSPTEKSLSL